MLEISLLRRAADAGNEFAMVDLAMNLQHGFLDMERDVLEAASLYERAVEGRDDEAMFQLGLLVQNDLDVIEADVVRSVSLLRPAIDADRALFKVAVILQNGKCNVPRYINRAVGLYELAIEIGDGKAMLNLVFLLDKGTGGMKVDAVRAVSF